MSEYEKWPKEWSNIRVAKMSENEDPGLNCFHRDTKITTICRSTDDKDWNLPEKTTEDMKKESQDR